MLVRLLPALILLTAGCIGSDGGEDAVETAASPDASGAPSSDAAPAAGMDGASHAPPEEPAAAVVAVPFAYSGATGGAVCPPPSPVQMRGHCVVVQASRGEPPEVATAGQPLAFYANLTAEAQTPVAQEFHVSVIVDMGNGWEWDPDREPGVTQAPPISAEWDLSSYPPGSKFMFYVESITRAGPVAYSTPHDFEVEGALVGTQPR